MHGHRNNSIDLAASSLGSFNTNTVPSLRRHIEAIKMSVLIKTSKMKRNPLLSRKQMVVDVIHPGRANVPKSELNDLLAGMFKGDSKLTITFGFRTKFGGGKSTGFCFIYDNEDAMMKFEPKHRMIRKGFTEKKERSRKAIKEAKNKGKKVRGTGRRTAMHKAKRAGGDD